MPETGTSLSELIVTRLVHHFAMRPGGIRCTSDTGRANRFVSREYDMELLSSPEAGKLVIRSRTQLDGWQIILRAIGSVQNWLTAELHAGQTPDDELDRQLRLIDQALDGLLVRALQARAGLLDQRWQQLQMLASQAQQEYEDARQSMRLVDQSTTAAPGEISEHPDNLWRHWLAWPDNATGPDDSPAVPDFSGSPASGYRFYLECTIHARDLADAALSLADELLVALGERTLTASIEPLGASGALVDAELDYFTRLAALVSHNVTIYPPRSGPVGCACHKPGH